MRFGWRRTFLVATGAIAVLLLGLISAASQAGSQETPQLSEHAFKNIQVLRGIPVDEFMDTMGMFAAALGYDCTDCHVPDIVFRRDAFAEGTLMIARARSMVTMMDAINENYFGGEKRVTCFTCHSGNYSPEMVPNLALQYGPVVENPSAMEIFPDERLSADEVFGRYVDALGGSERLAALTSFAAKGTYSGFDTGFVEVPVEIFARAPDQRTMVIHALEGDSVRTYDGRSGWIGGRESPVPLMALTGGKLAGARTEAILSFPAGIQQAFSQWQVGGADIDGRLVEVVQGRNGDELPVNLYFDDAGLLVRLLRWNMTAVGPVPTQTDYGDYRPVAGVLMPFRWTETWTNGRTIVQLSEVQPNVPIEPARFGRLAAEPEEQSPR